MDIWTNFGSNINLKRRELTPELLETILSDTPIGKLQIVCLTVREDAIDLLHQIRDGGKDVGVTTLQELLDEIETVLSDSESRTNFVEGVLRDFDIEFPMALSLPTFLKERGYK